jgi:hypothetical protein
MHGSTGAHFIEKMLPFLLTSTRIGHSPPSPFLSSLPPSSPHSTSALPEETQAKYQAIGHKYNVEYNRRAARHAGDLHRKVKLKLEAINALPEELQAEAKQVDFTPFPLARRITTHTPPIPGFEAGRYDLPGAI